MSLTLTNKRVYTGIYRPAARLETRAISAAKRRTAARFTIVISAIAPCPRYLAIITQYNKRADVGCLWSARDWEDHKTDENATVVRCCQPDLCGRRRKLTVSINQTHRKSKLFRRRTNVHDSKLHRNGLQNFENWTLKIFVCISDMTTNTQRDPIDERENNLTLTVLNVNRV